MIHPEISLLAKNLVSYSMEVKKGENVLLDLGPGK